MSAAASTAVAEGDRVYVSAASALEIAIKAASGKLRLGVPAPEFVPHHLRINRFTPLPVTHEHALAVHDLPRGGGDPFDRLLAAQAQVEELTLVSRDPVMRAYGVPVLW